MPEATATKAPGKKHLFDAGHTACAGCGQAIAAMTVVDTAGPNTIIANNTGCLEVLSTCFPQTAWGVPWIHSLFENAAAVASGVEAALKALGKWETVRVIAQGGDGSTADIGLQALSGMFDRGHDVLYVCYDNEAYMNTGVQRSGLTPFDTNTTTSPSGKQSFGNPLPKKNMVAISAAHGIPYSASASAGYPQDIRNKVKKALTFRGPKYLQIHVPCPLGWRHEPSKTVEIAKLAVETGLYPLIEYENGQFTNSRKITEIKPVTEYLKTQARFRHLLVPGAEAQLKLIQAIADDNIRRFNLKREEKKA
jgi:pyruvate ferredoxin oxidoreductase beta subunit